MDETVTGTQQYLRALRRRFREAAALENVPVFFAWDEPGVGPMCACSNPGMPPVPLGAVLSLLPCPQVGEARKIFGHEFRVGLKGALGSDR